jgi:hypothetical protein
LLTLTLTLLLLLWLSKRVVGSKSSLLDRNTVCLVETASDGNTYRLLAFASRTENRRHTKIAQISKRVHTILSTSCQESSQFAMLSIGLSRWVESWFGGLRGSRRWRTNLVLVLHRNDRYR